MTYRVLSLFAGIGGFDLGLERTGGFRTVAFCEIDKKAQQVLRKHWPEVPIYDDVRTITKEGLASHGVAPDFICAGFPCQDISYAGKGAGLTGERSGLFYEVARLVGELEPRGVLLENVSALLARGLGDVLGTLASLGYDAEWHCIPAAAVGAPHRRDRVWIYAYREIDALGSDADGLRPHRAPLHIVGGTELRDEQEREPGPLGEALADANRARLEGWLSVLLQECARKWASGQGSSCELGGAWFTEPAVGRLVDGLPGRVDRLKQLGNAVVPQIPEMIGRAILASEIEQRRAA